MIVIALGIVLTLAMSAGVTAAAEPAERGGAFTCDFGLSPQLDLGRVGPIIERDRMYQAARPGFVRKQIPIGIDLSTGALLSGGRYLFEDREAADAYKAWVENEFALDGVPFFARPDFLDPDCHAWHVIGAEDLGDARTEQVVLRTERWSVPADNQRPLLKARWPQVVAEARSRGLTGVWLLYNKQERLVSLVSFGGRVAPAPPDMPDFASLFALQLAPSLGALFADLPWTATLDRTQWMLSLWAPFVPGDRGEPSIWLNSPPFPEPYPGDGVCEVSRGEDAANSAGDCPAGCGDGIAQPGETTANCPGDVRLD